MQLAFDKEGRVLGAEIQTSLLEKARVCAIMPNERGFHIFFMITHYCQEIGNVVGDGKQDTDNTDAQDMLGDVAFKYITAMGDYPVREFAFTQEAANVGGAGGNWPAQDIAEFKKVMYSFRTQLGYTKEDTGVCLRSAAGVAIFPMAEPCPVPLRTPRCSQPPSCWSVRRCNSDPTTALLLDNCVGRCCCDASPQTR